MSTQISIRTVDGESTTYPGPETVEAAKRELADTLTRLDGYAEVPRKDDDGVFLIPVRHITRVSIRQVPA
jgi:translation elongation factor EF-Tu-like GTPase